MKEEGVSEVREPLGLDKRQNGGTHTSFASLGRGELRIHTYSTQRWHVGNKIKARGSEAPCSRPSGYAFERSGKENHSDTSRTCYLSYTHQTVDGAR